MIHDVILNNFLPSDIQQAARVDNCFITNAHKISRIRLDFICKKQPIFPLVFNFEQTRTVTIYGEHGIMAHIL